LGPGSLVLEVASNDGYLLRHVRDRGIPCVGIEPTASTAAAARDRGIETIEAFFGEDFARQFARERRRADLVVGNNVLAHVPDIDDFVAGLREVLAPNGLLSVEFPHLMRLVESAQFDTVYHEHFSYLSLHTVSKILSAHGLAVRDVEELPTHGGSLRVWAGHADGARAQSARAAGVLAAEERAGMLESKFYRGLQERAERIKHDLLSFLIDAPQFLRCTS
jgi:SAM-dependent methyltransferase